MAKTSYEYSKQLRKNIDNFSLQDSLKRVAKENEIASKLQSTSNVLTQEEQDLYNQTIHDRYKSYPMYEKGQHRPPGSPPERLNIHPEYQRTVKNYYDVEDKRGEQTERNRPYYPTFGTSGGGAPLRDEEGNKITNLKSDPETRFQPHKDGSVINEKAFRYIADMSHANEYIRELDDAVKDKQKQKKMEKEREEILNAMHKRVDYFGKSGGGAPAKLENMDVYTGVDLHQGFKDLEPKYTDRSVVRHYDLENYTRSGDKWKIPDANENYNEYGTEDPRLGLLPISPEVSNDMRNRKDESNFLRDNKKTPRSRHVTDIYSPWGRPGNGAPLREAGALKSKVAGKFNTDFYNLNSEENDMSRFAESRRSYLNDLKNNMVLHERQKRETLAQEKRESTLDLAEKIRQLDASGYPRRTSNGEVFADPRNLSDVSRHKLDVRYPNPLVAKSYHDFLTHQVNEKDSINHRVSERDMQEKKQHVTSMGSYFWKPHGHGAPYTERPYGHRRGKLGSQLLQGYPTERGPMDSQLPTAASISQPHLVEAPQGSPRMSMGTQTEQRYHLQAPFATAF